MTSLLSWISPRHRRWHRLLDSLTLDPDTLKRPVPQPSQRDFIICGSPRTGTTLLAAMLFQPPEVLTVVEPWDGMRLPPRELFASLRRELETSGRISRGRLDVISLIKQGTVAWQPEGSRAERLELQLGFALGVKWPAFWRYLEFLPTTKFLVCLRHPYEVIRSYAHVGGRLAQGLDYDIRFNRVMNAELRNETTDDRLRQVLLHDYISLRIATHLGQDNVFVIRYERWFTDPQPLMKEIGAFLEVELKTCPAAVRSPQSSPLLSADERAFIRKHCRTAEILGYSLDPASEARP